MSFSGVNFRDISRPRTCPTSTGHRCTRFGTHYNDPCRLSRYSFSVRVSSRKYTLQCVLQNIFKLIGTPWHRKNRDLCHYRVPVGETKRRPGLSVCPLQHGCRSIDGKDRQNWTQDCAGLCKVQRSNRLSSNAFGSPQSDQEYGGVRAMLILSVG